MNINTRALVSLYAFTVLSECYYPASFVWFCDRRSIQKKSVSDQSTLPNSNVIELRATLQSALERISELERSETENQKTIKHIKSENDKLKTDLANVNDILNQHCLANERKFIHYDANHKLFNQQSKAIGEFNFDSYATSVQKIGTEMERYNKLQVSLQKQVNELKLSTQKSYAEQVSIETPSRASDQTHLKQVNSIPNRSNQQTIINIPVCSPVTDLHSEVNKSANGNISPLSTPKSSATTNSGLQKLTVCVKLKNMTFKIPVRLDGVTEEIDTSPADSDENLRGKTKHTGSDYTSITKKTMIDYFLINKSVLRQLSSCEILDEGSISSTSDNLPIIVENLIDNNPQRIMNSYSKFPAWHKINDEHIRNYQQSIDVPLELFTDRIN
ncbi:unnamed protein product [Mytilus coruscus]|uniref:Uncharacterized protein n=1 Tax=Mytilus coruscus TaxID=42192 RepID=A0A6J7ZZZ3_MYTCO|nr:unnamed protein product [Mytilus coruscus]